MSFISKVELKKQLKDLGIKVEGNYVRKRDLVLAIKEPVWKNDSVKYAKELGEYLMEAKLTISSVLDDMNFYVIKVSEKTVLKELKQLIPWYVRLWSEYRTKMIVWWYTKVVSSNR